MLKEHMQVFKAQSRCYMFSIYKGRCDLSANETTLHLFFNHKDFQLEHIIFACELFFSRLQLNHIRFVLFIVNIYIGISFTIVSTIEKKQVRYSQQIDNKRYV